MKTETKHKERYLPPAVEVIPMETEGNCCVNTSITSGSSGLDFEGVELVGTSATRSTRGYNSATFSDIEDMINDILTIEK